MYIVRQASSVRADACANRRIILSGLWPDEAEKIGLLAEILGWEAQISDPGGPMRDSPGEARLTMRQLGVLIMVEADDPALGWQLARQGLDRLVAPVPLLALEQLLMFAA